MYAQNFKYLVCQSVFLSATSRLQPGMEASLKYMKIINVTHKLDSVKRYTGKPYPTSCSCSWISPARQPQMRSAPASFARFEQKP